MPQVLRVVTRLNRGGPLRQLEALLPNLPAFGYDGSLLAGVVEPHEQDGRERLLASGIQVSDLPSLSRGIHPLRDRTALRALMTRMQQDAPDLVHTHMGKAGALGRIAASRCGIPCVHTLHGHHFSRGGWVGGVARLAERRLAARTSAWITLSPAQHDDLVGVVGDAGRARIHVVAPGLDVARFAAIPMAPEGPIRLLWTGRFVGVKRVDVLLDAFACMRSPAFLTLVGGGPDVAQAHARVSNHPKRDFIQLLDEVADVTALLASHHVVVLSSDHEGTPLSLLEGMAAGRAVVATAVGGIPDLLIPERTGLLARRGDARGLAVAMDRVATNAVLRQSLGVAAAAEAQVRFGAERLARETSAVYASVLAAAKG